MNSIQSVIDDMNLASYSNLNTWVKKLEERVESELRERLIAAVEGWIVQTNDETGKNNVHKVILRNHRLTIDPPLEDSKKRWLADLNMLVSQVCLLERLQSSRYDQTVLQDDTKSTDKISFASILKHKQVQVHLIKAYECVENRSVEISEYVKTWMQYQALWDMEAKSIYK